MRADPYGRQYRARGVTVQIRNADTSLTRELVTDASGNLLGVEAVREFQVTGAVVTAATAGRQMQLGVRLIW